MAASKKLLLIGAAAAAALIAQNFALAPRASTSAPISAPVTLGYGPAPGFERLDVELIARAQKTIDLAAYVLSDRNVIAALSEAASRGVAVRIYLDPEQFHRVGAAHDDLLALINQPNVRAKLKSDRDDLMHLKSYAVDGRFLRGGSANFSWSGLNRQDNDIFIVDSVEAAANFSRNFEKLWARRDNRILP